MASHSNEEPLLFNNDLAGYTASDILHGFQSSRETGNPTCIPYNGHDLVFHYSKDRHEYYITLDGKGVTQDDMRYLLSLLTELEG